MSFQSLEPIAVKLTNGVELNYVRAGNRGMPVVIMIHGAMGDWRSWQPQWDAFTAHFDCISYSRRYSHPNPNELTTRDHSALVDAQDLGLLMDKLGIAKAILVGSSYGGFTALAFAVQAPERVSAVVSVEAPMMRFNEAHPDRLTILHAFREASALPARQLFENDQDEQAIRVLTGGIIGQKPKDVSDHIMARRMTNLRAAKSLAISNDEFPMLDREKVASLEMPILLISGAETAPVHAVTFESVSEAMPQARTLIVKEASHSVAQQQPGVFNEAVMAFLWEHRLGFPAITKKTEVVAEARK